VSGTPGIPHRLWLKVSNIIAKLPEMKKQLKTMEKKIADLEASQGPKK
jgi:UDP-3-O-[3-hydroxymyristoyl] glucosamine N-acyltransferase